MIFCWISYGRSVNNDLFDALFVHANFMDIPYDSEVFWANVFVIFVKGFEPHKTFTTTFSPVMSVYNCNLTVS